MDEAVPKNPVLKSDMGNMLKGLLMVGGKTPANGPEVNLLEVKAKKTTYDKNSLLEIGKNAASRKRPDYLDLEYDFVSKNDPVPRWDPERWHAGTKQQHMKNRKDSLAKETSLKAGKLEEKPVLDGPSWRKNKDKRASLVMDDEAGVGGDEKGDEEFRLGPHRRSYKEGCKPQNTRGESAKNNPNEPLGQSGGWREQRKNTGNRDGNSGWRGRDDEDKFRDFRKDGGEDRNTGFRNNNQNGFQNNRNMGGHNRQNDRYGGSRNDRYNREMDEAAPEWMDGGPTSALDFMELGGFDDDHRGKPASVPSRPAKSDSPELVAFDPSTFGGSEVKADFTLGDTLGGLVDGPNDDELADINGIALLGNIGRDIMDPGAESPPPDNGGMSGFSKFFADTPKEPIPPPPTQQPRAQNPKSVWGLTQTNPPPRTPLEQLTAQMTQAQIRPGTFKMKN
jgi:hypothetical protein